MTKAISFAELIPGRLRVNGLPDGTDLELMHTDEMGPEELAAIQSMQRELEALDGNDTLALVHKQNEVAGQMLKLLAPNLTDETLAGLKMGQRGAIIRWWSGEVEASVPKGNGRPSRSSKRRG